MNKLEIKAAAYDLIKEKVTEYKEGDDILLYIGYIGGIVQTSERLCKKADRYPSPVMTSSQFVISAEDWNRRRNE